MRIALLGELEVRDDDGVLAEIAGVRLRRLLARLVLAGGRPVSANGLVGAVWGDEPPGGVARLTELMLRTLEDRAEVELALGAPGADNRLSIKLGA